MSSQRETPGGGSAIEPRTGTDKVLEVSKTRKPFVEPEISLPVDVLEATAFFQAVTVSAAGLTP